MRKKIFFRKTNMDDLDIYFKWVNDPLVRQNSIISTPVEMDEHTQWFLSKVNNPNTLMYIFEIDKHNFGQVRFEIENNIATIDYSIDKKYRGRGLGYEILNLGLKKIISSHSNNIRYIKGVVKETNLGSIKTFVNLGFKKIENKIINQTVFRVYLYECREY